MTARTQINYHRPDDHDGKPWPSRWDVFSVDVDGKESPIGRITQEKSSAIWTTEDGLCFGRRWEAARSLLGETFEDHKGSDAKAMTWESRKPMSPRLAYLFGKTLGNKEEA